MPVLSISQLTKDVKLGLWKIDEFIDEFLSAYPHLEQVVSGYHHFERKRQKMAVYALLYAMNGNQHVVINHDSHGKPLLKDFFISISDTAGYVAIILSKTKEVAVDIEYYSNRVDRIAKRFLREDEVAGTTESRLIHWSAKETVFKYFSAHRLQYADMRLHLFQVGSEGCVNVDNLKANQTVPVYYHFNDRFVLTYTY